MSKGRYIATDQMPLRVFYLCRDCGGIVMDRDKHDRWHAVLQQLVVNADLRGGNLK